MADELTTLERLKIIFREVFDDDEIPVTPQLTANSFDGWDSLGNVRLLLEIERSFRVRFSAAEIGSLKNVEQLIEQIEMKLAHSSL